MFLKEQGINGKVSATFDVDFDELENISLKILLEHNVCEMYLNDKYYFAARSSISLSDNVKLGLFSGNASLSVSKLNINKLTHASDFGY